MGQMVVWQLDSSLYMFHFQLIDRLPSGINCLNAIEGNLVLCAGPSLCVNPTSTYLMQ